MQDTAIINGLVYTASSNPELPFKIKKGTILIGSGKIKAVGKHVDSPGNAKILVISGKIVTPGFIDAHCHIGISEDGATSAGRDTNESSEPVTAEVRALDAVNPKDIAFQDAITAGITCVQTDPGSANIIGGQTLVMKTWGSAVVDELVVLFPSGMNALGENPKRIWGQDKMPKTRMEMRLLCEGFGSGQRLLAKERVYRRRQTGFLTFEWALVKVLQKELTLRIQMPQGR